MNCQPNFFYNLFHRADDGATASLGNLADIIFEGDRVHEKNKELIKWVGIGGIAVTSVIAIVAFSALTATLASGGVPFIAAPLLFVSVNSLIVFKNVFALADMYNSYLSFNSATITRLNPLKRSLAKDTFCFAPVVNLTLDCINSQLEANQSD